MRHVNTFEKSWSETRDFLIATASAHGFEVSPRQIARRCHAGLLPHPKRRGLGQSRGTAWFYPPGTAALLLVICEIQMHERRFNYIAGQLWRKWRAGHDEWTEQVRGFLKRVAAEYERRLRTLARNGDLTKLGQRLLNLSATCRAPDNIFQRIRRRIGRDQMPRFMGEELKILSGKFAGWGDVDPDRDIVAEGLGVPRSGLGSDRFRWVFDSAAQQGISRLLHPGAFREVLTGMTNERLIQARNELAAEVPAFASLGLDLFENFNATSVQEQIAFLLVWLVFRGGKQNAVPGSYCA